MKNEEETGSVANVGKYAEYLGFYRLRRQLVTGNS